MLPADLSGQRFLDLGCNEGFFCGEALKRGASRVIGIEKMPDAAKKAQEHFPGATILNQSWDTIPSEQFDVIILLSALHYETRPRDLMHRVYDRLAPGGLFILECGTPRGNDMRLVQSPRSVGTVYYPTERLLVDHILRDFAVRKVGPSVSQPGDPIPRNVYHCRRRATSYVLVAGLPGEGKTAFSSAIGKKGVCTVSTDTLIEQQWSSKAAIDDAVLASYIATLGSGERMQTWVDGIRDPAVGGKVASFVYHSLPKEPDEVFVEGYLLNNPLVAEPLKKMIRQDGSRVWSLNLDT